MAALSTQEESKAVQPVSSLAVLTSLRKLPMFETYQANKSTYDFEWPTKSVLKTITRADQLRLKEIRYQQDALGIITALKIVCQDAQSPFFSGALDKKVPPLVLNVNNSFFDTKDGHYRCNNIVARIEINDQISNIYFNEDKQGIQRIGTRRGNGVLSHVYMEPGEQIVGVYGCYGEIVDRSFISSLGFIVWKPDAAKEQ